MRAAFLTILKNGEKIKSQALESEAQLGRGENCVIKLEDKAVSRLHAVLRPTEDGVQVEKKSAFAPLIVNGAECNSAVLKDGDVISVGPYFVKVSIEKVDALPAASDTQFDAASVAPQFDSVENLQVAPATEIAPEQEVAVEKPAEVIAEQQEVVAEQQEVVAEQQKVVAEQQEAVALPADGSAENVDVEVGLDTGGEVESDPIGEDGKTNVSVPTKLLVKLFFEPGTANVTEYNFVGDHVAIGRGKTCEIVLNDSKCSRKHAIISRAGQKFVIKDLQSANGTYVNGNKITEQELFGEDSVKIGDVEFKFTAVSVEYSEQEQKLNSEPPVSEQPANQAINDHSFDPNNPVAEFMNKISGPQLIDDPSGNNSQTQQQQNFSPVFSSQGARANEQSAITGIPGVASQKANAGFYITYIRNFSTLPLRKKFLLVASVILVAFGVMTSDDTDVNTKKKKGKKGATAVSGITASKRFDDLSPAQKAEVKRQYDLAFSYYQKKDYDAAMHEVEKIFPIVPDYDDAIALRQYAIDGKRKLEAMAEEQKRKEEEEKIKAEVAAFVTQGQELMSKKSYDKVEEIFNEIIQRDPENVQVAEWKKEIETFNEQKRIEEQQRRVQGEINKLAWELYKEGLTQKKQGRCHAAIASFAQVIDKGASDKAVITKAKSGAQACRLSIKSRRDPILEQAKQAEDGGEFAKAYHLYKRATIIDPPHPAGYAGVNRVKGILHDHAKQIYTEAILAESYSDFFTAKKKFKELLEATPEDDIYYQRAQRKLTHYFKKDEAPI